MILSHYITIDFNDDIMKTARTGLYVNFIY